MDKIAFVTGGTGFVGSHLVEELLVRDYQEVRCLVRRDPKWLGGKDVRIIAGDLSHENILRNALRDVTHVYHVAAVTRARDREEYIRSNVDATIRLLRLVRATSTEVERVLVTSSLAVVGVASEPIANEETPLNPVSLYGKSKALMESRIAESDVDGRPFHETVPITIVRPPSVYGPRERDIFTFFKTANYGLCPIVGGDAGPISLIHVRDLVRGMVLAAEAPAAVGRTYFLGPKEAHSWEQVRDVSVRALGRTAVTVRIPPGLVQFLGTTFETVAGVFGAYPPLNSDKAREIIEACKACSSEKAMLEIGYSAAVSLEEGISSTIEWYRKEGWLS